jgi:hypothetical protein
MSEEPRSLAGYKSKVHEAGEFENPNEGKPLLNDTDEYVLQLVKFPHVKEFPQVKEKKDGTRTTVKVDKAICEFVEEVTKNVVTAFFRVDSLNFSDDEAFESAVVRFFKKIKAPIPENTEPEWDRHFIVGMRFRSRVAIGKDEKKVPNGKYFLDVPTCRPLLPSDKHPDAIASAQENNAKQTSKETLSNGAMLANAKLIVVGAANGVDAYQRLLDAKVTAEVIQAFLAADKRGEIKYPIA